MSRCVMYIQGPSQLLISNAHLFILSFPSPIFICEIMSVSVETLERRLSDLDRCYRQPVDLDFNPHSTAADPVLSASWKNSNLLNYRAGLTILDVEADILSKKTIPITRLFRIVY
jgi:hypothetical protein